MHKPLRIHSNVKIKRVDLVLLVVIVLLAFFGLLMIYDASSFISFRDFHNKYHYIVEQSIWMGLGFIGMGFFTLFDYKKFYYLALPLLIAAIFLLISVFIPCVR